MLSILLVSRDVSLFADIFLRLGLKKIGHEFKQDSVDLQIFLGNCEGREEDVEESDLSWELQIYSFSTDIVANSNSSINLLTTSGSPATISSSDGSLGTGFSISRMSKSAISM